MITRQVRMREHPCEVHPPMRGYSLIIRQGGHNFRTWVRELPPSLVWLSRSLS